VPIITKIGEQKRNPRRRNVHLDGKFAFVCSANVVVKFRLHEGMVLTDEQVEGIREGQDRQKCFDKAMKFLARRLHSRMELQRKLMRQEYAATMIEGVLDDLVRLGYVDDARFAKSKALVAAERKQQGRRRAQVELMKTGVSRVVADRALEEVYEPWDSMAVARRVAEKHAGRLRKLEPVVARRRLAGMLLRRGFEYEEIGTVIDEVLGAEQQ
jgi:regulatory protein